jgi:hypothetical protein
LRIEKSRGRFEMKSAIKIPRRKFLKSLAFLSLVPFAQSCKSSIFSSLDSLQSKPKVDILLEGTEEDVAKSIQDKYDLLKNLYDNPGKELTIGFVQDGTYNILKLSFVKDDIVSYPHLKLVNTRTGEVANVVWGIEGLYPSIKFVDNSGRTIVKNGRTLEFALKTSSSKRINKVNSPSDWILIGIKVFAVALLLWIGLSVVKYIVSAIAFIAFNAMVIGLVLAGFSIVVQVIQWILDKTGITLNDVIEFFKRTIEEIVNILRDVIGFITSYWG